MKGNAFKALILRGDDMEKCGSTSIVDESAKGKTHISVYGDGKRLLNSSEIAQHADLLVIDAHGIEKKGRHNLGLFDMGPQDSVDVFRYFGINHNTRNFILYSCYAGSAARDLIPMLRVLNSQRRYYKDDSSYLFLSGAKHSVRGYDEVHKMVGSTDKLLKGKTLLDVFAELIPTDGQTMVFAMKKGHKLYFFKYDSPKVKADIEKTSTKKGLMAYLINDSIKFGVIDGAACGDKKIEWVSLGEIECKGKYKTIKNDGNYQSMVAQIKGSLSNANLDEQHYRNISFVITAHRAIDTIKDKGLDAGIKYMNRFGDYVAMGVNKDWEYESGWTLLKLAAKNGVLPVVMSLVDHGADVNLGYDKQDSALHLAIKKGHIEVAEYLRNKGAKEESQSSGFLNYFASSRLFTCFYDAVTSCCRGKKHQQSWTKAVEDGRNEALLTK